MPTNSTGDRLRTAMTAAGFITAADLAATSRLRLSGIRHSQVVKWLTNKPIRDPAALFALADALNVAPRYLIGLSDSPVRRVVAGPDEHFLLSLYARLDDSQREQLIDYAVNTFSPQR